MNLGETVNTIPITPGIKAFLLNLNSDSGAGYLLSSDLVGWVDYSQDMLRTLNSEGKTYVVWAERIQM
jgi:hypothetical protein